MNNEHLLKEIVRSQKSGVQKGICSVCSASGYVIEAAMDLATQKQSIVLIEATCNQINQFGGYTGMKPADFRDYVYSIAAKVGLPKDRIILGGDHLGPNPWKDESSGSAMEKACEMMKQYVLAGFTKIHIDASMHLADDSLLHPLPPEVVAERGAVLCKAAEEAFKEVKEKNLASNPPVYVIGTEVPVPGGTQGTKEGLKVTEVSDFKKTIEISREAFLKYGLENAWENVVAVVVQPGVEFGDSMIHEYNHEEALRLCNSLKDIPSLVFEGHSTDYQTPCLLKSMVEDGIAILKVGPALTFAAREALFMLNLIENELFEENSKVRLSHFIETLDKVMVANPKDWNKYYLGSDAEKKFARKYSMSDRCRYYMAMPEIQESISILVNNLSSVIIPLPLISQYLPVQYRKIRSGLLKNNPVDLIKDKVRDVLEEYDFAVTPAK